MEKDQKSISPRTQGAAWQWLLRATLNADHLQNGGHDTLHTNETRRCFSLLFSWWITPPHWGWQSVKALRGPCRTTYNPVSAAQWGLIKKWIGRKLALATRNNLALKHTSLPLSGLKLPLQGPETHRSASLNRPRARTTALFQLQSCCLLPAYTLIPQIPAWLLTLATTFLVCWWSMPCLFRDLDDLGSAGLNRQQHRARLCTLSSSQRPLASRTIKNWNYPYLVPHTHRLDRPHLPSGRCPFSINSPLFIMVWLKFFWLTMVQKQHVLSRNHTWNLESGSSPGLALCVLLGDAKQQ